jgi:phosphoribosylformimino-5-aminoimidazole carboxamide ribotide isomerase
MRVIPVLDLRAGRAVHARGGARQAYGPVRSALLAAHAAGDALALGRAFRDRLGCDEWYVADLDAIEGGAPQWDAIRELAALGGRLLVDAGVAEPERARALVAAGAARVVVGLETLPAFAALERVAAAIGAARVVFSLDLRHGNPLLAPGASHRGTPPALAAAAVAAGAGAILVLDLARVGSGRGVDAGLVAALRRAHPDVELLAGGGIASARELERLAAAGLDAALVATALHDGTIGRREIAAARRRRRAARRLHSNDSR